MDRFDENFLNEKRFIEICKEMKNLTIEKEKVIDGFNIMIKLLTNIIKQPNDVKFRNFKITNEALKSKVLSLPKAIEFIELIGYKKSNDEFYIYESNDMSRLESHLKILNDILIEIQQELNSEQISQTMEKSDSLNKGERVLLLQYDISQGMARTYSPMILGKVVEAVWHTSLVVYGKEYYFGGGVCEGIPRKTPYGRPLKETNLGMTEIPLEFFKEYLVELKEKFNVNSYHILNNNCNHFTNEISFFLTGKNIPDGILNQHKELNNTPMGKLILPMLEKMNNQNSQAFPSMFEGRK